MTGESPALQTLLPAVRFVAFTCTKTGPVAGVVLGSVPCSRQFPFESVLLLSRVARTAPVASVRKSFIPRDTRQAAVVFRDPLAFTVCLPLSDGLPLLKITVVFRFFPARAAGTSKPTPSAATASGIRILPALITCNGR